MADDSMEIQPSTPAVAVPEQQEGPADDAMMISPAPFNLPPDSPVAQDTVGGYDIQHLPAMTTEPATIEDMGNLSPYPTSLSPRPNIRPDDALVALVSSPVQQAAASGSDIHSSVVPQHPVSEFSFDLVKACGTASPEPFELEACPRTKVADDGGSAIPQAAKVTTAVLVDETITVSPAAVKARPLCKADGTPLPAAPRSAVKVSTAIPVKVSTPTPAKASGGKAITVVVGASAVKRTPATPSIQVPAPPLSATKKASEAIQSSRRTPALQPSSTPLTSTTRFGVLGSVRQELWGVMTSRPLTDDPLRSTTL